LRLMLQHQPHRALTHLTRVPPRLGHLSILHLGQSLHQTRGGSITVTLDRHDTPRVNRALTYLTDELNTTPAHMPGDPRPITYQLTTQ
ncbi:MAG: hypothetical protein ACRDSZ_20665, partial [Pseudonocardiaceae bacterium]